MAAGQALVREAMTHLRMRKGATLAQIRQQIESNYAGKMDVKKRGLLTSALKGLLEKGQVEKKGANYTLARAAKLKPEEDEMGVPGRHHRRRRHHGSSGRKSRRRRHIKRRKHHRRRRVSSRRLRHSRRRKSQYKRRRQTSYKRPEIVRRRRGSAKLKELRKV